MSPFYIVFWECFLLFLPEGWASNFVKRYVVKLTMHNHTDLSNLFENNHLKMVQKLDGVGNYYVLASKKGLSKKDKIPIFNHLKRIGNLQYFIRETWRTRDLREKKSQKRFKTKLKSSEIAISDPMFQKQWYLNQITPQTTDSSPNLNVIPVWSKGYDGTGVTVAVLDDGLDYSNRDIIKNYNQKASFDFQEYDEDPMPKKSLSNTSHGTKCASIIAGSRNDFCGIGVAYNASLAGIRVIETKTTDSIEAGALSHKRNLIDIYTCNWGPRDDGERFGRPGLLASKALYLGTKHGRNGLGSIFVWSSGNGGDVGDDCNADGYVTSLYTISIGAISNRGQLAYYSEACSSVLAVTFSANTDRPEDEEDMITADIDNECSQKFSGTSAAASLASGVIALMLQARKNLTWRDVQQIIVDNAVLVNPADVEWKRNGAGKWFNRKFGFGGLDATRLVAAAINWTTVDAQKRCISKKQSGPWKVKKGSTVILKYVSETCSIGKSGLNGINDIQQLEHIQVKLSLSHKCRGRLHISLISPSGTSSVLLSPRKKDKNGRELQDWIFKSVHFWGEPASGQWSLVITDSTDFDPCHESSLANPKLNETKTDVIFKESSQNENLTDDSSFFDYLKSIPIPVEDIVNESVGNKSLLKLMDEIIDRKMEKYFNRFQNKTSVSLENKNNYLENKNSALVTRDLVNFGEKSDIIINSTSSEDYTVKLKRTKLPDVYRSYLTSKKNLEDNGHTILKRSVKKNKEKHEYAGLIKSWSLLLYGT